MLTLDQKEQIKGLKDRGYSQRKVAVELKLSRSTVARHWGASNKLTLDLLFVMQRCGRCSTHFPMPKFVRVFYCPYCSNKLNWKSSWFKPAPIEKDNKGL